MTRDAVARDTPATAATSSRVGALSARKVVMPPVSAGCMSTTLRASYRIPAAVRFVRSRGGHGPVKALTGRTACRHAPPGPLVGVGDPPLPPPAGGELLGLELDDGLPPALGLVLGVGLGRSVVGSLVGSCVVGRLVGCLSLPPLSPPLALGVTVLPVVCWPTCGVFGLLWSRCRVASSAAVSATATT